MKGKEDEFFIRIQLVRRVHMDNMSRNDVLYSVDGDPIIAVDPWKRVAAVVEEEVMGNPQPIPIEQFYQDDDE